MGCPPGVRSTREGKHVEPVDPTGGESTIDQTGEAATQTPTTTLAPPSTPTPGPSPTSTTNTTPPTSRRSLRAPIIVGVSAIALGLGLLGHQVLSTSLYEAAWSTLTAAETALTETTDRYERALDRSTIAAARAEALQAVAAGDLVSPDTVEGFRSDIAELRSVLESTPTPRGPLTGLFADPAEFAPAWERYADVVAMAEAIPARDAAVARFDDATSDVRTAQQDVLDRTDALFAEAFERAAAEIDAHPLASYRTTLGVRHLIDADGEDGQTTSAAGFTALTEAVAALRTSQAEAEVAQREHPQRTEIEGFARSISQGVTLDFVWAFEVAGVTSDGWYAGTAEFWPDDGGWGHITLSYSIEDNWSDENAKAVVVHEVGHTQAIRPTCAPIFEGPEFHSDHEAWATAWAIGMGYDLPGAGIEPYGRPTDAQIAAAAQCR